jgi:hypothetical protein
MLIRMEVEFKIGHLSERLTRFLDEEERAGMKMSEIDIQDYARQLLDAHGGKAVAEAAQKASASEKEGKTEDAENWRGIEAALKLMRGPHQK